MRVDEGHQNPHRPSLTLIDPGQDVDGCHNFSSFSLLLSRQSSHPTMSDQNIFSLLGSISEGATDEELEAFMTRLDGLSEVVSDMQQRIESAKADAVSAVEALEGVPAPTTDAGRAHAVGLAMEVKAALAKVSELEAEAQAALTPPTSLVPADENDPILG